MRRHRRHGVVSSRLQRNSLQQAKARNWHPESARSEEEAIMFPLSHMLKSFVRIGTLKVIDAGGRTHVFAGAPGPSVTMRLTDRSLYRKLFLNPELHAGEAYMGGRMRFEDSTLRDFLTLFSMNRLSLGNQPLQRVLRRISRALKRFQQANPVGKAERNVAHHYDLGNDFYKLFLDEG